MSANSKSLRRGFTLLEVMISLAILAIALVAIGDLNGGAVQMHYYARRATQATLLLNGKMLDIEDELQKDGFHDFDDEKHGTFDEEQQPDYSWKAEILKPDIQLDENSLLGMLGLGGNSSSSSSSSQSSGGLAGLGAGGAGIQAALQTAAQGLSAAGMGNLQALSGAGGLQAMGPMAGLLQGQAKTFIEQIKKSVREVRLTVSWKDGKNERQISASQTLVILPEMVGKAGQVQTTASGLPGVNGATGPTNNLGNLPINGGNRIPFPGNGTINQPRATDGTSQ